MYICTKLLGCYHLYSLATWTVLLANDEAIRGHCAISRSSVYIALFEAGDVIDYKATLLC